MYLRWLSSSPDKCDAATVESDLANLNTQTKKLDASINAFPNTGGTLLGALTIHNAAVALDNTLKTAINHANASSEITETEGNAILELVKTLVVSIQQTLTDLVNKKAAIAGLPILIIVLHDLQMLKNDSEAFIVALLAKTPAALVAAAEAQASLVSNAFSNAIAAYQ